MNAADTLDAAHAALETARDAAMTGPWRRITLNHWGTPTPGVWADGDDDEIGYPLNQPDADLLVVLHATIDAQLSVLRAAYDKATGPYSWLEQDTLERLLAGPLGLARAILGAVA